MKLCIHCKHYVAADQCDVPQRISYVTGAPKKSLRSCELERTYCDDDSCGPNAKWFEESKVDA